MTHREVARLPNIGPKTLKEVEDKLAEVGLSLGMALDPATYRAAMVQARIDAIRKHEV
jgi:DNA-directed RNA polymerase alpha subunit